MAKSLDYRKRVHEYYKIEGHTIRETARVFKVGKTTIENWEALLAETGSLEKRPLNRTFKKIDPEKLKTYVNEHASDTLAEIAEHFNCTIHAVDQALRKHKITYKKKEPRYIERNEAERKQFVEQVAEIEETEPKTPIYYVDESGIDQFLYREKGRAPRGVKLYAEIKGKKFKRKSIVAGKCGHKIVAPLMYDGTMDGTFFTYWFENHLLKEIEKGAVVIMDNATVHSKIALFELAEATGVRLIFQPAYSPDLNKIEKFWAWLKRKLRKILPDYAALEDAICAAFRIYVEQFVT